MTEPRDLADKMRRRSSTRVSFEAVLAEICDRLENEGGEGAKDLVGQGRELQARIRAWTTDPPSEEARTQTIHEVTLFNQSALEILRQA